MKKNTKKDLKKRSISLFVALAVCLTMAQAPAFTVSAHAEEVPETTQTEGNTLQNEENEDPISPSDEEEIEDENADGGNVEGEGADGEKVEGGDADGGNVEGEDADNGNVEGGDADNGNVEGEDADNGNVEGGDADGGNIEGEDADNGNVEGEDADGENVEGEDADGENVEGENPDEPDLAESFWSECLEAIEGAEDQESMLQAIDDCLNRYEALSEEEKAELAEIYGALVEQRAIVSGEIEAMNLLNLEDAVAVIGETGYASLQEAINAAASAEDAEADITITLQQDVEENIIINGAKLTLNLGEFTIRGTGKASVVTINGGDVIINGGTITGGKAAQGGGVYVSGAEVLLEDVTIDQNVAYGTSASNTKGGGLYIGAGANVVMSGGSISNNVASYTGGYRAGSQGGRGGGVYIADSSSFTLDGGIIDGNAAGHHISDKFERLGYGSGGGVYVGAGCSFEMNNGSITNNTAYGVQTGNNMGREAGVGGGGISVNSSYDASGMLLDNVHLNSGIISGNTSYVQGGGIYIHNNSLLIMQKVAVTENDTTVPFENGSQGGGIWYCDFSQGGYFYASSGGLITNNQDITDGQDFLSVWPYYGKKLHIATRLYDGTPITWKNDGTKKGNSYITEEVDNLQEFLDQYANSGNVALKSETTGTVDSYYRLVITENHATQGGGVASNGLLVVGDDEGDIKLTVNKVWKDADDNVIEAPENVSEIVVDIVNKAIDKVIDTVTLNNENNWTQTLIDLPNDIEYEVRERSIDGYEATYSEMEKAESFDENDNREYTITVTNKPIIPKGKLIINKNLPEDAPEEAKTKEYTFIVTGPNNYNESFDIKGVGQKILENLDLGDYEVTEQDAVIDGYNWTVSVNGTEGSAITVPVEEGEETEVTFVNSYTKPTPPPTTPEEPDDEPDDEPKKPEEPDEPETPDNPTEEIFDEEPPLSDVPEIELSDEDVPLAEKPQEVEVPEVEVPEEEVPLADIPKTGDSDGSLWAALLAVSMAGIALLTKKLRGEE